MWQTSTSEEMFTKKHTFKNIYSSRSQIVVNIYEVIYLLHLMSYRPYRIFFKSNIVRFLVGFLLILFVFTV